MTREAEARERTETVAWLQRAAGKFYDEAARSRNETDIRVMVAFGRVIAKAASAIERGEHRTGPHHYIQLTPPPV